MPNRYLFITGLISVILAFSSCASFKKLASTPYEDETTYAGANTAGDENITFIDDVSLSRRGRSTDLKGKAYHSDPPPVAVSSGKKTTVKGKYAQLLEVASADIDNLQLYNFIDDWWGAPYRYGGESRKGIDCSAFVQILYGTVFGLSAIPRTAREQYEAFRKIRKVKRLKEGDLVFFRIRSRHISHVGVYLQNNKFVHASLSAGVTISDLTDSYWKRYFVCGGELPPEAAE